MENCVQAKLQNLGYIINTTPLHYIDKCNEWYKNEIIDDFHKRTTIQGDEYTIDRMNFAKKGCEDDANLCEVININVGENEQSESVRKMLSDNRFDVMYRQQLERMSATGTVGAYVCLDHATYLDNGRVIGGEIKLIYCYAENYIPLKIVNDEIIEAAFYGIDFTKDGKRTTLVTFTLEDRWYKANTYVFDKTGKEVENYWIQLADVKPFEIMRVAKVNNIDNMEGFGLPKVWEAIPTLKKIDLCNMILNGDLEKGEKLILTNESTVDLDKSTGKPKKTPLMKKLFIFIGEKLPQSDSVIQEYNPEIRIDAITKSMELCLSLFSMMFGFGSKKYTFENGQIQTATQYIGERQDAMQELNKQRKEATDYISHLVKAMMWFSNTFCGTSYNVEAEICIDFDDSYIEDKNTRIESMKADAQIFSDIPEFTIRYIMERLNVERDEAVKIMENRIEDEEPETED